MLPVNVVDAPVKLSIFVPRATLPLPLRFCTVAPLLVAEMSSVPLSSTLVELAMLPLPPRASVAPLAMAVLPV